MAEFPALPLWTDAYLGDTTHLSTIEHGAYLLLLITAWRTRDGILPDDDRLLARYAKLTPAQWKRMKPIIAAFFVIENSGWKQGRLHDERDAVKRNHESHSTRGKAGAEAKALKRLHRTQAEPKPSEAAAKAEPEPSISTHLHPQYTSSKDDAPEGFEFDPVKALFDAGLALLEKAGVSGNRARSIIGKWRKQVEAKGWDQDSAIEKVAAAIAAADMRDVSEPVAWITARLASIDPPTPEQRKGPADFKDIVRAELAREEARA